MSARNRDDKVGDEVEDKVTARRPPLRASVGQGSALEYWAREPSWFHWRFLRFDL